MKKLCFSLFILLALGSTQAFACICAGQIHSSYDEFKTHINAKLNDQLASLKTLNNSLAQNITTLSLQNKLLIKQNALLKNDLLQEKRFIFEFNKKNEMR